VVNLKTIIWLFSFILSINTIYAQQTVTGRVIDAVDGEPLLGVNVVEKGTVNGTSTDIDGNFSIDVPTGSTIEISYISYKTQTIEITENQDELQIELEENTTVLDELIVVGYGSKKRSNITGSVSRVSAEEIEELPILRPEQALQGTISGVTVSQVSGSPGSPLTVRVRGTSTINNSDPLYIVDGMPVDGMDFLSANDIESIDVLKDAASTAIYGSRGANGVVLITTKSGKVNMAGKMSYDFYYGIQSPWKKSNLLNAREYAILSNESRIVAGLTPLPEFANPDALGEGTDWLGAIFQDAPITSHNVSFIGGKKHSTYSLSANYFKQDGIVGGEKSGFKRYTVRVNSSSDLKRWLKVGSTVGVTYLNRGLLHENNEFITPMIRALNMDPVTPVYKQDGTYAYSLPLFDQTDITNPVNAIEQTYDYWTSYRALGSVFAEAEIVENLKFKTSMNLDATFASRKIFYPKFDLSNDTTLSDAPAGEKSLFNSVVFENNVWRNWQWENVLSYEKVFKEKHAFSGMLGTTVLENWHTVHSGGNTDLPSNNYEDAFLGNTIGPIRAQTAGENIDESALLSVFSRVNYAFDDKYLFSATVRRDGSSRFGENNRFGVFPSVSAGWVVSRENFWTFAPINFLKLKASWGQNGIDRIGNYSFATVVLPGQNYTFSPDEEIVNGAVAPVAANPDLKWETVTQTDIGLEAEFWDGKLYISTDYYVKTTTDMLARPPISATPGSAAPERNIGSVRNKGWEFMADHKNHIKKFKYNIGINFSILNNEVLDLGDSAEPIFAGRVQSANASVSRTDVGHPIASFYGYVTDGVFQTVEEVQNHAFQTEGTAPGDIRFKDLNGDGVVDEEDQTYIGNPTPNLVYGANLGFNWKGLDFSLFLQGTQGNDIYNATVRYDFPKGNRPNYALNRWTGEGTSNDEPRLHYNDPNNNARVSDRFVEDGSYMRVKNVQLGYSLPKKWIRYAKIDKFRVYVSAQNLFTFTKYRGMEPEIGITGSSLEIGIDRGFYPQARTFLAGLNVTF